MNKRYLNLKSKYKNKRSGVNIGQELIAPCLEGRPRLYRRGTAYFSSSSMKSYASSVSEILAKDVKIEILCSPVVQDQRLIKILESNSTDEKKQENILKFSETVMLDAVGFGHNPENINYRSKVLSFMIASGQLEIKFAIPKSIDSLITKDDYEDLYHVKNGYFLFHDGTEIAFDGSFNESESGHSNNYESTQVFRSYINADLERLKETKDEIDEEWSGKSEDLIIYHLNDEIVEKIRELAPITPPVNPKPPVTPPKSKLPFELRKHQNDALEKWKKNDYKGILALATGAGKTITAIHAAVVAAKEETLCVIIAVPYVVLAEQWIEVLSEYRVEPYKCFGSSSSWYPQLSDAVGRFNLGIKNFLPIIVVNATLRGTKFQSQLKKIERSTLGNIFMISDECHHHANQNTIKKLPKAKYIMGLSATPWNKDDEESRTILKGYYGDIVAEYTLDDAMDDGILCQYSYQIHEVEMSSEEEKEYLRLTRIISSFYKKKTEGVLSTDERSMLENTIFKRARLLDGIEDKFEALGTLLKSQKPSPYKLFYCGSGFQASYEEDHEFVEADSIRIIDRITSILADRGWNVSKFTSEESQQDRRSVLQTFKSKLIHAIAAIKVLDEGFDVPMCNEAYFTASSSSERQWVQRRGRILRKSDAKKDAKVHDFVITKTSNADDFKELVNNEIKRVNAFYQSCSNKGEIQSQIQTIKNTYNL